MSLKVFTLLLGACALLSLGAGVSATRIHYNGYKVFRITPQTAEHESVLKALETQGFRFWDGPNGAGHASDVEFPPHAQGDILDSLLASDLDIQELVSDVDAVITEELKGFQDSLAAALDFDFAQYHSVADAHALLGELAANHSAIATTISIGQSFEGRDLKLLKISKSGETKPAIWFDSNIHAREWITSAVCLYVVNHLLTSTDPAVQRWTQDYDWYILPHHNPDGFEYARTTDRLWRKTRSTTSSPLGCRGADANRNFDFHWLGGGSSTNPCDYQLYAGPRAFSEVETKAASDFQTALGSRLKFVLSLHSYSQYILIPYGVHVPFPPHDEYMRIGRLTATAIAQRYGTQFTPGNTIDLVGYIASGGSGDWAAGVRNVPLVYTFEMRDKGAYGFLLPANQIVPSALEFIDGLAVMIRELGTLLAAQ